LRFLKELESRTRERVMTNITIKIPNWLDIIFAWPVMVYRRWQYGYDFRRIYLSEGEWTILDWQDYCRFAGFKWEISGDDSIFYAVRNIRVDSTRTTTVRLHRLIMNAPRGLVVDHINGDSLDNRRANLRLATHSQNSCNKKKRKNTTSQFRGVCFCKAKGKWDANINLAGKRIWLGSFDSEIEAGKAYDEAAKKYHGEFARLNFP
jgi:hypothetical protein